MDSMRITGVAALDLISIGIAAMQPTGLGS